MHQRRKLMRTKDENDELLKLPRHVVNLITGKLNVCEFIRFGAVCAPWRSIAEAIIPYQESQIPWLILGHTNQAHRLFNLLDRRVYEIQTPYGNLGYQIAGSNYGWFISRHIFNPFTGDEISLPKYDGWMENAVLSKAPSSSCGKDRACRKSMDCVVVASDCVYKLAFCRPSDIIWTHVRFQSPSIEDIAVFNGCVYVLSWGGNLLLYDLDTYRSRYFDMGLDVDHLESHVHCWYLVQSCGELLMVRRTHTLYEGSQTSCRPTSFKVFKLDIFGGGPKWVKVESLGEQALFVGRCCSLSLPAINYLHGIRRNCIYFTNDRLLERILFGGIQRKVGNSAGISALHATGVFSLEDGSIESYLPDDLQFNAAGRHVLWLSSKFHFGKPAAH
uniref:KIB1-4 beta-propeller domain-containing protein n=1 Tax=Davidia involucrata TaxID=16924 RepID=A0A5B7BTW6_DAVIN